MGPARRPAPATARPSGCMASRSPRGSTREFQAGSRGCPQLRPVPWDRVLGPPRSLGGCPCPYPIQHPTLRCFPSRTLHRILIRLPRQPLRLRLLPLPPQRRHRNPDPLCRARRSMPRRRGPARSLHPPCSSDAHIPTRVDKKNAALSLEPPILHTSHFQRRFNFHVSAFVHSSVR